MKKYLRLVLKYVLGGPRTRRLIFRLRSLWLEVQAEQRTQQMLAVVADTGSAVTDADMPEIAPIIPRSSNNDSPRINLLIPFLSETHIFGGTATALRTFERISKMFPRARIVITDEINPALQAGAFYSAWPILDHLDPDYAGNHIVGLGKRFGRSLTVTPNDVFVSTIWYSAYIAYPLLDWQDRSYGATQSGTRKIIYLIQDYEPGFYPWSTRYALAASTYSHPDRTLAIFNTRILADYFSREDYGFPYQHVLEPRLHPKLAAERNKREIFLKQKQMLIYGRPGTDRNAFPIIVAALRQWSTSYGEAQTWKVLSAGEEFASIELGNGCTLQSLGKLPLVDYAEALSNSAVGISLMVSPHPSYPPMDMAAFGVHVITNRYANKDLGMLCSCLHSIERLDPNALCNALSAACLAFDRTPQKEIRRDSVRWNGPFLDGGDELEEIEGVLQRSRFSIHN